MVQRKPSRSFFLVLYFLLNLALTLYNKLVLIYFPFPYSLTAIHALCGTIGGSLLVRHQVFVPANLGVEESLAVVAFSFLYSINIVVSNASLRLVTVAFHQVVRAASPAITAGLAYLFLSQSASTLKLASIFPVVFGVGLATYGDYDFTFWGFVLTVLGTFLASFKTIVTNLMQSSTRTHPSVRKKGLRNHARLPRLHPLDLLNLLSPLAFIQCVVLAYVTGELTHVRDYSALHMTMSKFLILGVNGFLAFGLNVVSFMANRKSGPLTMSIAANIKQVVTVICAVSLFDLTITPINGLGIAITLVGGAMYAFAESLEGRSLRVFRMESKNSLEQDSDGLVSSIVSHPHWHASIHARH